MSEGTERFPDELIAELAAQVAVLQDLAAQAESQADHEWSEEQVTYLAAIAERLGNVAMDVVAIASEAREDFEWWRITADPAIIPRIAKVLTYSGFQTLASHYRELQEQGILPAGMSAADVRSWFQTVQDPVAAHMQSTTGRRVIWRNEGKKLTLSFLDSRPEPAAEAEPKPAPPPAAPTPPRPAPSRPAPTPPAPAPVRPAPPVEQPAPAPRQEKVQQDPAFTPDELTMAEAVLRILSKLGTTEQIQRRALLVALREARGVSRTSAKSGGFERVATSLIRRLAQRGHIDQASVAQGSFKYKLPGELRTAWLKGDRKVLTALQEAFVITRPTES